MFLKMYLTDWYSTSLLLYMHYSGLHRHCSASKCRHLKQTNSVAEKMLRDGGQLYYPFPLMCEQQKKSDVEGIF